MTSGGLLRSQRCQRFLARGERAWTLHRRGAIEDPGQHTPRVSVVFDEPYNGSCRGQAGFHAAIVFFRPVVGKPGAMTRMRHCAGPQNGLNVPLVA